MVGSKVIINNDELNVQDACDLLRQWREDNERKSEDVVEIWNSVLKKAMYKLGNETYTIYEQVLIAALDCKEITLANQLIALLSKQFPGSLRVQKYKIMTLEAQGKFRDALALIDDVLEKDPTNTAIRKRGIVILKNIDQRVEAISDLVEYLKKFMADQEAWHQLCNLYLYEQDFGKAAFCMEEVLLHNPHNHLVLQRLGDIKYSQGGIDNMEISRAYYLHALKLNKNNLRALYGVFMCTFNIINSQKLTVIKRKESMKSLESVLKRLKDRYTNINNGMLAIQALESIL